MHIDNSQALEQGLRHRGLVVRPLLKSLENIRHGQLNLLLPNGGSQVFTGEQAGPVATLTVHRPFRLMLRLLQHADIGFAEAYMAGDWESDDLGELLQLLALNEHDLGLSGNPLLRWHDRLQHLKRQNNLRGSRRNIAYHYDLGNDFYRLWLDRSMTYSAALFEHPSEPLEQAQERKYQRMLQLLDARPGSHILEIGCGWGGFAEFAARQGHRITGITLSREQLAFAQTRIARAGLSGQVELRLQDYRQLDERFDHIVSIEMFEAVGERYWPTYFETLRRCLRPGGRAALQVITIDDEYFNPYRQRADFIQKYIFPGGMLPSVKVFSEQASAAALRVCRQDLYGLDYAETLRRWDERFTAAAKEVARQGFDARFMRMWRYYLAYCEAGFRSGRIDLMQVALEAR